MKTKTITVVLCAVLLYMCGKLFLLPMWGTPARFGTSSDFVFLALAVAYAIACLLRIHKG